MAHKDAGVSIADVYAEALHDATTAAGVTERVEEEVLAVQEAVRRDRKLLDFLDSPLIPFPEKQKALRQALEGFHPLSLNFLFVVVDRQRVEMLRFMGQAFRDHCNRDAGLAEFSIESARALEEDERRELLAALKQRLQRPVTLTERVKPGLLGGFVLAHDDFRWNASLALHLQNLVLLMAAEKTGLAFYTE
jgi:F-type H+-transporting ATPase subunit delta